MNSAWHVIRSRGPVNGQSNAEERRRLKSKLVACAISGVVCSGFFVLLGQAHRQFADVTASQMVWLAAFGMALPPAVVFMGYPFFVRVTETVADLLAGQSSHHQGGNGLLAQLDRKGKRELELDWTALAAGLAVALDADLPERFVVSAAGSVLVLVVRETTYEIDLAGRYYSPSNAQLAAELTDVLLSIREFARAQGASDWKPAATGSVARVAVAIDCVSLRYEILGRPTGLLGTLLPLVWRRARAGLDLG